MTKFIKVYKAPGYPVDPAKQEERDMMLFYNAILTEQSPKPRLRRYSIDLERFRVMEHENRN